MDREFLFYGINWNETKNHKKNTINIPTGLTLFSKYSGSAISCFYRKEKRSAYFRDIMQLQR